MDNDLVKAIAVLIRDRTTWAGYAVDLAKEIAFLVDNYYEDKKRQGQGKIFRTLNSK